MTTPSNAQRLAKLCGMLGSAHAGERAAAALKADQFVRSCGETWESVIVGRRQLPPPHQSALDWRAMVDVCIANADALAPKEKLFVQSMARWSGEPSPKQMTWLEGIFSRVRERAA
jgi:hypothetical protein